MNKRGKVKQSQRRNLWLSYGCRCYSCRDPLPSPRGEHMRVEHLIPLSDGGYNATSNYRPSCIPCALTKDELERLNGHITLTTNEAHLIYMIHFERGLIPQWAERHHNLTIDQAALSASLGSILDHDKRMRMDSRWMQPTHPS